MTSRKPQFRLASAWSKAGEGTCIVINLDEIGKHCIAFDIGATPIFDRSVAAAFVFISHGHLDHIGAIFSHARAHHIKYSTIPTYYVPHQLVTKLESARDCMFALDSALDDTNQSFSDEGEGEGRKNLMPMKIVGVKSGEEFCLKPKKCGTLFVKTFSVDHGNHPSIGYVIGRIIPGGLLPQYKGLSGPEMRNIIQSGINVKSDPIEVLEVAYTGDTCANGLLLKKDIMNETKFSINEEKRWIHLTQAFQAPLILCELTFLASSTDQNHLSQSLARKSGHLHIDDIDQIFSSHGWDLVSSTATIPIDVKIIFFHLSNRYAPASRLLNLIASGLPKKLINNAEVALSSFIGTGKVEKCEEIVKNCLKENGCVTLSDYLEMQANKIDFQD